MLFGALVLLDMGWLIGQFTTDRWHWSQWLWWIPTPIALAATLLILLLVSIHTRLKKRHHPEVQNRELSLGMFQEKIRGNFVGRFLWGWRIAFVLMLARFGLIEHRWFHAPSQNPQGVRLVHWTMSHPRTPDQIEQHAAPLIALNGDITILSEAWMIQRSPSLQEWLGELQTTRRVGRFTLFTRFPILELRSLIATKTIRLDLAIIDTTSKIGRPLTMYLIDLPSRPRYSRMKIVNLTQTMMKEVNAPPPDLVVGDFNITRGSASLKKLFPDLHDAWNDAGHGYGASFHRRFPLYHIDHVLLAPHLQATRYDLIDPGVGRHDLQVAHIQSSSSAP